MTDAPSTVTSPVAREEREGSDVKVDQHRAAGSGLRLAFAPRLGLLERRLMQRQLQLGPLGWRWAAMSARTLGDPGCWHSWSLS